MDTICVWSTLGCGLVLAVFYVISHARKGTLKAEAAVIEILLSTVGLYPAIRSGILGVTMVLKPPDTLRADDRAFFVLGALALIWVILLGLVRRYRD